MPRIIPKFLRETLLFEKEDKTQSIDIAKNGVLARIQLRCVLTYQYDSGTEAGKGEIKYKEDDILNIIKRVRIKPSRYGVLKEISGEHLYRKAWYWARTKPEKVIKGDMPAGQKGTAVDVVNLNIYFTQERSDESFKVYSSCLDTDAEATCLLEVDCGSLSDVLSITGDATVKFTSLEIFITLYKAEITGNFVWAKEIEADTKIDTIYKELNDVYEIELAGFLRHLYLIAEDETDANSDEVIEKFKVYIRKDGIDYELIENRWDMQKDENKEDYNLETTQKGYVIITFDKDGTWDGMVDLRDFTKSKLQIKNTAKAKLRILTEQLIS
jgi:hypothetical protein